MAKKAKSDSEVRIGLKGVKLRGELAEDVRLPIKRAANLADSTLRVIDNIVGLPADFISTHLEPFRQRYREEVHDIPEEHRQEPPLRVGCSVLRHVAFAAEEAEIQVLFANLLATASDKRYADKAHPGFATVINDLQPKEAQILAAIHNHPGLVHLRPVDFDLLGKRCGVEDEDHIDRAFSNLLRLGLVEWVVVDKRPQDSTLRQIVGKQWYRSPRRLEDFARMTAEAVNELQNVKNAVVAALQEHRLERQLRISLFGIQFLDVCLPTINDDNGPSDAVK